MPYARIAAGALIFMLSNAAAAADWKVANLALGSDNRGVTFVDVASVETKGGTTRFHSEHYFEKSSEGYDRVSAVSEVDCSSFALTVLRKALHSGSIPVAFNNVPHTSTHYSSTSSTHWMIRRICSGQYLSGPIKKHGPYAARMFSLDWSPVPRRLTIATPIAVGRGGSTQLATLAGIGPQVGTQHR